MATSQSKSRSELAIFVLLLIICYNARQINGDNLQGMFVFGSSVVDNGNNNFLENTGAKANYAPYGEDFQGGPTGRFSNGKNLADLLAEHLNVPVAPPFADPQTKDRAIVHGVNFASAGSGILDDTGSFVGKVITLNEQLANFEKVTLPALEGQLQSQRASILPNYLFLMAAGNNDYLLNYFLGQKFVKPEDFAAQLIDIYSKHLKRLYNFGARKFMLVSVYPLGCSPVVSKGMGCLVTPNTVVSMFYDQLVTMVAGIKPQLPGVDISVVNSVKIIRDVINNAASLGFSSTKGPCCELGGNGASCEQNGAVCDDRNSYVYFDGQHTTEAVSAEIVKRAFKS